MAKAKLKAHPYADLFPMMTGTELEALAADIKDNGLRTPVVLYGGDILDGRNRLAACEKAGVEPSFSEFDGDDASAMALVISLNVQRRDLTPGQRALVAAKTWMASGDTKKTGPKVCKDFTNSESLAATFKVSRPSISQARDLLEQASDLAEQVNSCALTLANATDQLKERVKVAKQKAKDAERASEYSEAVQAGDMTIEEAIQKSIDAEREQREIESSQADSRRQYLKKLAEVVAYIETFMSHSTETDAGWFWEEGPGMFDHGITSERITSAADLLKLAADHAPKGKSRGKK